jgi:A/G-specific adenine glycosylase
MRGDLLAWYDTHKRDLPWRRTNDAYAIWVSEIMLQQTRVAAVLGRYESFLKRFPTVVQLAQASEPEVLALWSGLGYYRRARNLHRAAKVVAEERGGVMPRLSAELRELPGIGAYTSAAIASIAFGETAAVVDGNVERVIQRVAGVGADTATGGLNRQIAELATSLLDPKRPGDFNQAMMELGASVCLPRNPLCLHCPLRPSCQTRGEHLTARRAKMSTENIAYALSTRRVGSDQEVLLVQRATDGTVMPGMWELPGRREGDFPGVEACMEVRHAIMQVQYKVRILPVEKLEAESLAVDERTHRWVPAEELGELALTGLARKVLIRAGLLDVSAGHTTPELFFSRNGRR